MGDMKKVIHVADHRGIVSGVTALWLYVQGYTNPITAALAELEQTDQAAERIFSAGLHIYMLVLASARVGDIHARIRSKARAQTMHNHINEGTGADCVIRELAQIIASVMGFLVWGSIKLVGEPKKLMGMSRLAALGWYAGIELEKELRDACNWFVENPLNHRPARLRIPKACPC